MQPTHYQLTPRMPLSWPALQWRAVASLKCQQRSKVEGCLLRLLHRQQALAWSQWRAWVQHRWAQGAGRVIPVDQLHRGWSNRKLWIGASPQLNVTRDLACALRPCFQCRAAKVQADLHRERHLMAVSLSAFKAPLARKAVAEACLRRLLNRQLAAAFSAWCEQTGASRALEAAAADKGWAVVLRMQNQLLAAALSAWRAHAQLNRRLRQVLRRIQHRSLLAALHSWRDWTARMARARQLMQRSLAGTQAWAFAVWREAAAVGAEARWALEQVG